MSEDDEIVQAFLEESRENLDRLDRDLVDLEATPGDPELLASVFRTVHTIKGTCGFLGFSRLEALAHVGESLLGALRNSELSMDAAITTSLLRLIDAIRAAMNRIQSTGAEGGEDHAEVIADLNRHLGNAQDRATLPATPTDPEPVLESPESQPPDVGEPVHDPTTTRTPTAAAPEPVPVVAGAAETSVRIDVTVLDRLLNLVGELVLASSQIDELAKDPPDGPLTLPGRQLRLVTDELQDCVMEARLQPVGLVTGKFRRIARDLATSLGKQVVVELEGEDVGVDKAVNEALKDPLLHLVRNAIDHGLEMPNDRIAAGKPAQGQLVIRTSHENGRVQVEVSDDGRGIDVARLLQRATSIGLLTTENANELTRADALKLIFRPGLTTKEEVSNISGRGVGMDAVQSGLESVGGSIDIISEPGVGTVFKIAVPLTLSIMPVLITRCAGERYAIPQVDVDEVVHLEAEEVAMSIDQICGARIHTLRGQLLPLVDLAGELGEESAPNGGSMEFVVVETEGRRFGIVVDSVGDAVGTVVKPMTPSTRSVPIFGGVTILGDGGLSLILDTGGLAIAAGITAPTQELPSTTPSAPLANASSVLLVTGTNGTQFAVRLALVDRLEHFPRASVEHTGRVDVVQYRDGILPLIPLAELLPDQHPMDGTDQRGGSTAIDPESIHAVVCDSAGGLVGLVVDHIEDIVPEPVAVAQPPSRRGVSTSLILGERVIELLDIDVLVADAGVGVPA
jgi:two-component system chemotaxis sensor kinase CheA